MCSVDTCDRPHYGIGYCHMHYQRMKKGIPLDRPTRMKAGEGTACSVDGCSREVKSAGYCCAHYTRTKQGISMDKPLRVRSSPGTLGVRRLNAGGYVIISVPRGTPGALPSTTLADIMVEHRYVMQKHIGRPLLQAESVHHKDGNRQNNHISNLELRSGAHGVGIRVEDGALAHIAYLEQYAGLDLYERAVLSKLREKAEKGLIWIEGSGNRKVA